MIPRIVSPTEGGACTIADDVGRGGTMDNTTSMSMPCKD